jgi:hypothetical protein
MNKYVVLFSVFVLTGCAMFTPGVCDRTLAECTISEVHDNSFRLNIFNSSWNTNRIYIHCAKSDRRMSTINNPTFSATTSKVVRLDSECWSIYLIVSGFGQSRRSDSRSVLPNEDICADVIQTMDVRWGICPITKRG